MVTDSVLVMRTDLYHFNWSKSKSEPTRFLFPLCCTLTAHFSRKESQFDLYTVSISVDQAVESRKKRGEEARARGAETLRHRRDAAWAKGASAPQ